MSGMKKYVQLILNLILPIIGCLALLYFGPKLIVFFMPFVVGWIISLIANPLVHFLDRKLKIVRKAGSAIVIILVLAVIVLACYGIVIGAVREIQKFSGDVPAMVESAKEDYSTLAVNLNQFVQKLPEEVQDSIYDITGNVGTYVSDAVKNVGKSGIVNTAGDIASNVPGILIGVIVGLLASYFFIAEKETLDESIKKYTPEVLKRRMYHIKTGLIDVVAGYFKAQLKIMVVVYVLLCIGLAILRVPYFLIWAFFIALLDMLPFFGTGTVLGPWAIIELLTADFKMAIGLIVLYAVTQVVRQLIQPKLLGDSIGMNPFAALFFMFLGYKVAGVIGMIVSVPIAMLLINMYKTGAFDTMIYSAKELTKAATGFLHIDIPEKEEKSGEKEQNP